MAVLVDDPAQVCWARCSVTVLVSREHGVRCRPAIDRVASQEPGDRAASRCKPLAESAGKTILVAAGERRPPGTPLTPPRAEGRIRVDRLRNLDVGGVIVGLIILGVGLYYFGQKTLGLSIPDLDWDKIWPLFVIALGIGIVFNNWVRANRMSSGPKGS